MRPRARVSADMPREVFNALSAVRVRQEKVAGIYADGCGLYLVVSASGARWWQWRGMVHGRRVELGMGSAREVSLTEARRMAVEWRKLARAGGDPRAERDKARRKSITFEEAARRVWADQVADEGGNAKHRQQWIATLEKYAFPKIGPRAIHAVDQSDMLRILAPIWTETPETARRVRQRLRVVLDWARAAGLRDGVNPVEGVEKGLPKQKDKQQHFAALPWAELPALMKRLAVAPGMGAAALRLTILTAARSGETRGATWDEIDPERATWTIPAARMKAKVEHRVPLSRPALAVLDSLDGPRVGLVFPSARRDRPLSDMTLSAVLKRLNVPVTVHGFRSTFRDWAEEAGEWPHEVKESALAHTIKDKVEAAYRRGDLFEKRKLLMDAWGAYCG